MGGIVRVCACCLQCSIWNVSTDRLHVTGHFYSDARHEKHLLTLLPYLCPKGSGALSCHVGLFTFSTAIYCFRLIGFTGQKAKKVTFNANMPKQRTNEAAGWMSMQICAYSSKRHSVIFILGSKKGRYDFFRKHEYVIRNRELGRKIKEVSKERKMSLTDVSTETSSPSKDSTPSSPDSTAISPYSAPDGSSTCMNSSSDISTTSSVYGNEETTESSEDKSVSARDSLSIDLAKSSSNVTQNGTNEPRALKDLTYSKPDKSSSLANLLKVDTVVAASDKPKEELKSNDSLMTGKEDPGSISWSWYCFELTHVCEKVRYYIILSH